MNSYQYSTFNRMVEPDYDGHKPISELKQLGSFGIGTFHALDGELVVNAHKFYHCRNGKTQQVNEDVPIAWAWLCNFNDPQRSVSSISFDGMAEVIKGHGFSVVKDLVGITISGIFKVLKLTSTPKQDKPYPTIAQVIDQTKNYFFTEIAGTAVGCYVPNDLANIQKPGLHLHFINSEEIIGGHILDFYTDKASIKLEKTKHLQLEL